MRDTPEKETLEIEFKSDVKGYPDSDLIDEIVGMANTRGGNLYLGIEDDGTVTGVSNKHRDAIGVTALIANNTIPPISVRAAIFSVVGKDVLEISVPESRTIVATAKGKILRRRLNQNGEPEVVPLYPYEISSRLSDLSQLDFSRQPVTGATPNDLDPVERQHLRNVIAERPGSDKSLAVLSDEELDQALHLTAEVNGARIPTLTGMLLLGKASRIEELVPTAGSVFQVQQGTSIRVNEEDHRPLLQVFDEFEMYLKAWNPEKEIQYGLFRISVPDFDWNAYREALVNAFCHRDYTRLGSVRVMIDDEGMTISNPGGFIDGVSYKNLLTVEPHGRNPLLADALKRIGLAEKTGRGIDRIFEGSIQYGRPWPDYSESTSANVKLLIQRAKPDPAFVKMLADEQNRQGRSLSIYWLMILSALRTERRCSIAQLSELTNLSVNRIRLNIENLVETGLVEGVGNGKNREYILSAKLYHRSGNEVQYIRQAGIDRVRYPEMILKLAEQKDGYITKGDVCELCHITPNQAYSLIRKLVEQGKLEIAVRGKYARYKLAES